MFISCKKKKTSAYFEFANAAILFVPRLHNVGFVKSTSLKAGYVSIGNTQAHDCTTAKR